MIDTPRFRFLADALNAAGGFADGGYLVQYPRESNEKFQRRKDIAWYRNFMRSACADFVGYLSKRRPLRTTAQPLLQAIIDDADGKGNALDVLLQAFMLEAKARGSMLLTVDMEPAGAFGNRAEQLQQRAVPYLVMIEPERIISLAINDDGLARRVEITDLLDGKAVVRGWDESAWWVRRNNETLAGGKHGLGVCPVLLFTEGHNFGDCGEFAQIADLGKRYFNLCSERDEILRAQTFSLLTYQVPPEQQHLFDGAKVAEAIGTHNMLIHNGDAPAFIAPPDGPANIYNQVIADIEEMIRRIAMIIEQPSQAESGLALTIRFQQLNSALISFARKMEDLERRVWWLASKWLGLTDMVETSWPKDYSLADINQELAELQQLQASAFPPSIIAEKQKQITGLMLSNLAQDELSALLNALDSEHLLPAPPDGAGSLPAVDLAPIETRLDSIENRLQALATAERPAPILQPIINVTVPEQAAPVVTVEAAQITVAAPVVNVTVPEQAATPQPITVNTGSNAKVIDLVRDNSGNLTGAHVRDTGQ